MEHISDYMSGRVGQYDRKQKAGRLRRLRDLIRNKRLFALAKKIHDKNTEADPFGLGLNDGIKAELDRMHKEADLALGVLLKELGSDEIVKEIEQRLTMSDEELEALLDSFNNRPA